MMKSGKNVIDTLIVVAVAWFATALAVGTCSAAVLDYTASLAADFQASYPGGDPGAGPPTANPFGASSEWELHGPSGTAADLFAHGGLPASGQFGWCEGTAAGCSGSPLYTYFAAQWFPGVTIIPGVGGHAPQEVVWTAPGNVDAGGISIRGSIEQLFETSRRLRLKVFKNASATPEFFVDSLPPIVPGVLLQRVDFGPIDIFGINPGDTLKFVVDGSGAGGNGIPTFGKWDVVLTEIVPEPTSFALVMLGMLAIGVTSGRKR